MRLLLPLVTASSLVLVRPPEFIGNSIWPVDRIAANLERHLADHPSDPEALYALGRVHAWAFSLAVDELSLLSERLPPDAIAQVLADSPYYDACMREGARKAQEKLLKGPDKKKK